MAMFQDESLTETLSIEDGLQLLPECGQGGCSSAIDCVKLLHEFKSQHYNTFIKKLRKFKKFMHHITIGLV